MPYGPYSPVTTPLPSISGDGQLYSTQQFQFPGTYYQQPAPPNMPYLPSPTSIPQADLTLPIDRQGLFPVNTQNFNTQLFGPRPGYQLSYGSFGREERRKKRRRRKNTSYCPCPHAVVALARGSPPSLAIFLMRGEKDRGDVKLEQGLEMLSIFKKHEYEVSILDDFEFYEDREKALQERKAHQQQQHQHQHQLSNLAAPDPVAIGDDLRNPAAISGDFISQISGNFAHAVRLEERSKSDPSTEKSSSLSTVVISKSDSLEKPATTVTISS
ncbi:hypothetical protein BHM03_00013996 [Ensete ventricosum]|nr:hypothetical protein BHM03_00013996 [Ensete ventricosum]